MRVALCLSGHLRSFVDTHVSLRNNIIDKLNADVFIHTWNFIGSSIHIDGGTVAIPTVNMQNQIKAWYKPVHMTIEPIKHGLGEKYRKYLVDPRCPNSITNMFYKIHMADKLRQDYEYRNNFTYNLVIRARPDLLFESSLHKNHIDVASQQGFLCIPEFGHFDGINDQFAFGNSQVMSIYSNCYNELDKWAPKVPFKPEPILKHHVMEHKLPIQLTRINYVIKRANGKIFDTRLISSGPPDLSKW